MLKVTDVEEKGGKEKDIRHKGGSSKKYSGWIQRELAVKKYVVVGGKRWRKKDKKEKTKISMKKVLPRLKKITRNNRKKIVGNSLIFSKTIHFPVLHGATHIIKFNLTIVKRIG